MAEKSRPSHTPFSTGSVPLFTLSPPAQALGLGVDAQSDLITDERGAACGVACGTVLISEYPPPVSATSTAKFSFVAVHALESSLHGFALDGSGNLWAKRKVGIFAGTCSIAEFPAPLSATTLQSTSFAFNCGQLEPGLGVDAQGNVYSDTASGVDVFKPPFGANSTAAFTIPVQTPVGIAFDRRGNLYVSSAGNIVEFSPPFSAGSAPVVSAATPTGATRIAIGP